MELAESDPEVSQSALHAFKSLEQIYRGCILDAQKCGEIDPSADPDALATFFLALTRGMEVLGNAGISRTELTSVALTSLRLMPGAR